MADDCTGACCSAACLAGAKAGLAVALTLEALVVVLVGRWLSRRAKAMHLANAFAAGVFISAALVHILPHATESLSGGHDDHSDEGLVAGADADLDADDDHEGHDHGDDHEGHDHERMLVLSREEDDHGDHDDHDDHSDHSEPFATAHVIALGTLLALLFLEAAVLPRFGVGHGHGPDEEKAVEDGEPSSLSSTGEDDAEAGQGANADADADAGKRSFFSAALLLAAFPVFGFAIHSFLESVSFGLAPTLSSALSVFTAIAAHRWIVAAALFVRLTTMKGLSRRQRTFLYLAFVAVLPLGVALGAGLSRLPGKVEGAFVAASGGTFIYLAFEGMHEEMFAHRKWLIPKFVALAGGVLSIIAIDVILRAAGVSYH